MRKPGKAPKRTQYTAYTMNFDPWPKRYRNRSAEGREMINTDVTKFEELYKTVMPLVELTAAKNAAYGSSFDKTGDIMRILYPEGVKAEQMDDMLAIARVIDKLFRIATKKDAFGEDPWKDILGYAMLSAARNNRNAQTGDQKTGGQE